MKKIYLLFLFLIVNMLFSQKRLLNGYYIDNQDQKISFTIKYWELRKKPQTFDVFESNSTTLKTITINEAKMVVIDNVAKYVRGEVAIDRHSSNINSLEKNPDIIKNIESHFFNCIVEGKYCLLSYEDEEIERYFYSTDLYKTITQLDYKQYYSIKLRTILLENNEFINQLYSINTCDDTAKINAFMPKCKYRLSDLTKVFKSFNECSGDKNSELKFTAQNKGKFLIKGILTLNRLELVFAKSDYFVFEKKYTPGAGAEVEYVLPYYNNLFSGLLNFDYATYKSGSINDFEVEYTSFNANFGIQLNLFKYKGFQTSIFTTFNLYNFNRFNFKDYPYNTPGFTTGSEGFSVKYKRAEFSFRFHSSAPEAGVGFSRQSVCLKYTVN